MIAKEEVLLVVLIETARLRWFVAAVDQAGKALPLLESEPGDLAGYLDVALEEQVGFLRHRLSGALQRGNDRLWGREKKASQVVFVADGPFSAQTPELTNWVAEHFVEWMIRPAVAFFICPQGFGSGGPLVLERIAGDLDGARRKTLECGLGELLAVCGQPELWEKAGSRG